METLANVKAPLCKITSIYFNYYQAERNLGGDSHAECGMNVIPEGISRFPTIPFNAVAFAMDETCKTVYKEGETCENCLESEACKKWKKLKLHAEFKGEPNSSLWIRAIDPLGINVEGLDSYLEKARVSLDDDGKLIKFKSLLGDIEPIEVCFNEQGNSYVKGYENEGVVEFTIANADIWSNGICASWQLWQWQYRTDEGKPWEVAGGLFHEGISVHRIFVTKKTPTWPWTGYQEEVKDIGELQQPAASRWPYISGLEWACKWAEGETTEQGIASKITAKLNDGTGERFKYQMNGANNYTSLFNNYFDCGRFIDRLNGKFGRGPNVNCVDCTHMVISLANALGCQLQPGKIEKIDKSNIELNPLTLIGYNELADPKKTFAFHQVAISPSKSDATPDCVYDACIKFDKEIYDDVKSLSSTTDPENPLTPQLNHGHPVNIPIGEDEFTYGYLAILVKPNNGSTKKNLKMNKDDKQTFSISALKQ